MHERPSRAHKVQELLILLLEKNIVEDLDLHARLAQKVYAAATHLGVGIQVSGHDPLYAGPQDRIRTRGRLTVVVAGLERHVQLRPPGGETRTFEGSDLRMIASGASMPAFAYHRAVTYDDRPHQGIGGRGVAPVLREF